MRRGKDCKALPDISYGTGCRAPFAKAVLKWASLVGIVCMFLFEVFPGAFIRLFGSDGDLYLEFAVRCLRIYLLLILFTCVQKVCAIFLQSIGRAQLAAPLAILRDLLLIAFSIIMPLAFGVTGIFWAAPIADVISLLITAAVMLRIWKELQGQKTSEDGVLSVVRIAQVAEGKIQPSRPGVIVTISHLKCIHYMSTNYSSRRTGQFLQNKKCSIYYCDESSYKGVMLTGRMEVCTDHETKALIWKDSDRIYYPEGVDDPDYCVFRFTADKGNYYHGLENTDFTIEEFSACQA